MLGMCPATKQGAVPIPALCMPMGFPALQVHLCQGGGTLGIPLSGAWVGGCLGSAHTQGEELPALDVAQGLGAFLRLEEEQRFLQ